MSNLEPEIRELSEFLTEFNKESDRGAALAAAALLDERLVEMLKYFFADVQASENLLTGFNAPLGTFSSKITAAYSLGLLQDNEYRELNLIRKIRNEFAQSWKNVNFETERIEGLCSSLPWLGPEEFENSSSQKERFIFAVTILLTDLLWRVRLITKERRSIRTWEHKSRKK